MFNTNEIIPELFITNFAVYTANGSYAHGSMFGKYKPSKDTIHYEQWGRNGTLYDDATNNNKNGYWWYLYYARRHQNIPSDKNLYNLHHIWYGGNTSALWA